MKIVFLGTPDFAVASLEAIKNDGHEILAVVTAPDKPAGRGQKLQQSAVKQFALMHQIEVMQPVNLKTPEFLEALQALKADIQVVVAFRMLPEVVWNMPPHGTVNVHGSLLPQYRGAAPINHAIIQGETESGVTTFLLKHEIDTGNVLFAERVAIGDSETAGELHDKLMEAGARTLVQTLRAIEVGNCVGTPQSDRQDLKHAPKLTKAFCEINWNQPAQIVHNHIRGLSPYPTAFTYLNGKSLKVFKASILSMSPQVEPGMFETDGKNFLRFATQDAYIELQELQLEGKKRMDVGEFLRGLKW